MSYDIDIIDPKTGSVATVTEPHFIRGGTYAVNGTTELSLNITYNYYQHFHRVLGEGGIRSIYGKRVAETLPTLAAAVNQLKDDVSDNYWDPTEGNARLALLDLICLGAQFPEGIWRGD
jgi:hypothetical protein